MPQVHMCKIFFLNINLFCSSLVAQMVKKPPVCRRPEFYPWVGKIPWRRKWKPTPEFLPEESHGQRSLSGYSPPGCKEPDMTKQLTFPMYFFSSLPSRQPGLCVQSLALDEFVTQKCGSCLLIIWCSGMFSRSMGFLKESSWKERLGEFEGC